LRRNRNCSPVYKEDEPWGDNLKKLTNKKREVLRIIFWNCGGFPNHQEHPKNQVIWSLLVDYQADIAGLAELITCWNNLSPHDQLNKRTWGWFSSLHISLSYASLFPTTSQFLTGGAAVLTMNEATHQVAENYMDSLGRWVLTRLRRTNNIHLCIIAACHCVHNITGPLSVWNQQRYLMDLKNISNDPIEEFDQQPKRLTLQDPQVE
jgi:hypothetical protein